MSTYGSINEPQGSRQSFSPRSINEPPQLPTGDKPVITSLEPASCALGDAAFTLDVTGTGFKDGSVISLDGLEVTTTYNDETTLSTLIDPVWFPEARNVPVAVRTGIVTSESVDFTVTDAAPEKTLHMSDPDELEEEIEEAEEEGEFRPTHKAHSKSTHKRKK